MIIKNYTGDILNFETATELLHDSGVKVTTVVIDDDVAVKDSLYTAGRRGVANTVLIDLTCHQNERIMFKPELLSPAGTLKNMRYAFAYGADAVYAGQPRYSLRVRNNEFNHENLQLGINEAHALGKKFYVVVNIAPHNAKLKTFIRDLKPVVEMGPDALIMSDRSYARQQESKFLRYAPAP